MIKKTFIIALLLIGLLFGGGAIVALFSLVRFTSAIGMISTAQDSLLQRQSLREHLLIFKGMEISRESILSSSKDVEALLSGCLGCHGSDQGSPSDKDALFVIKRFSMLNLRLKDMAEREEISSSEVRMILKKMDELAFEALVRGRALMEKRIEGGTTSLRLVSLLTTGLILAGGLILVGVFLFVRNSLHRNIFSIIRASEEISQGRDVAEVDFSSDFEPVRRAFLKLQDDLKKKEEEIRNIANRASQAEKLTALGELVAGVSHELNNPLQIIVGYSEMIMTDETVPEHHKTILSRIYDSALRASRIIKNLRDFARQREFIREAVDLRQIVNKVVDLLDYEFTSAGIEIRKDYQDVPPVIVDFNQIEQVVMNLLKNAYDAIVETGRSEGMITVSIRRGDGSVIMEISDTGIGIPEEHLNRIFEPFFTTKPVGKGTGLGLSITYGIIKAHNGDISVKSTPGKGTTFTIELPLSQ